MSLVKSGGLKEVVPYGRASMTVAHRRPTVWRVDQKTGLNLPVVFELVDKPSTVWNLIMNAGRIQLHTQGYGTAGLLANGFNYIALSDTTVTADPTQTTLAGEIATSGLSRVQGTVTLPTGSGNQTTIDHTFTASGAIAAKTAALFTAASVGIMNHALGFPERTLVSGDTLQITYTITLG